MKTRMWIAVLLLAPLALAQEAPSTVAVAAKVGTVRKTLDRSGTFLPAEASELKLDLRAFSGTLTLEEVAPNGRLVNKGDVVARLKTRGIDRQIEADEMSLKRTMMDLNQAEERARMQDQKAAASLERAQRDAVRAAKRLEGYVEHEKALDEEGERMGVESRKYRLEDQADELEQLEKMYSEDELVDATEEIVLKRQRRNFARTQANFDLSEKRRLHRKAYYDTWRREDLELDARHQTEALERTQKSQAMDRQKTEMDLGKRRYDLDRAKEKMLDLRRDREQFVIRAPRSGILLHGKADAAPWTDKLKVGGSLKNRTVFATVAAPDKLKVATTIEEKNLFKLKVDIAAEVEPKASPKSHYVGPLSVEHLPYKAGEFKAEIPLGEVEPRLRPGMRCKVAIILGEERDVIVVPASGIQTDGDRTFVYCSKVADGPFEERDVVIGLSDGDNTAVREGLADGEFVKVK
ncbi:MAG: efflux RND transporter periplasmic adaptor subunit [Planctomycetota bacterium]|jgi:multidrug resistance efflux pump